MNDDARNHELKIH